MNDKWEIIHGDALKVLREFAPNLTVALQLGAEKEGNA